MGTTDSTSTVEKEKNVKRPRAEDDLQHARKRTAIACDLCRLRKTRCDNAKPSCGFCKSSNIVCKYSTAPNRGSLVHEPSPTELLERINYAVSLLEGQNSINRTTTRRSSILSTNKPSDGEIKPGSIPTPGSDHNVQTPSAIFSSPSSNYHHTIPKAADELDNPGGQTAAELLLDWPILRGFSPLDCQSLLWLNEGPPEDINNTTEKRLSFRPGESTILGPSDSEKISQSNITPNNADIIPLVNKYLNIVYIKNPILDATKLKQHAAFCAEVGPQWDGQSCLVLLACAIAVVVNPLNVPKSTDDKLNSFGQKSLPSDKATADAYYSAARRRMGLLEVSLLAAQCHYLAGIYEICHMRALEAWSHYQQASVNTQILLWKTPRSSIIDNSTLLHSDRHILERLYYSCVRTEGQFRIEVAFPPCGLTKLSLSNPFPSPPCAETHIRSASSGQISSEINDENLIIAQEDEMGWFYYLADISLLRTSSRFLRLLYNNEESWWLRNIDYVIQIIIEFEKEIELWYRALPYQIQWDSSGPKTELSYVLHRRYLHFSYLLYHPMVYIVIHGSSDEPHFPTSITLARKCLTYSAEIIGRHHEDHWRHGGLWFTLRTSFRAALSILAAIRSGIIDVPTDWQMLLQKVIKQHRSWENEATNIKWMRHILESLFQDTLKITGQISGSMINGRDYIHNVLTR